MRQRLSFGTGIMLGAAVLLGVRAQRAAAQSATATGNPATVAEQYLFAAANAERTQRGLTALRWDAALSEAAGLHAREMAARGTISHQFPGEPGLTERARQAGAHFSVIAENVAEAPTPVRIHDAWMASEGHRANLLDPRVNAVGIRVLRRDGQLYAVEDLSRNVETLSLDEQESAVRAVLAERTRLTLLPSTGDARRTCAMDTGYAVPRTPGFVMRYTTADLTVLPDALRTQLTSPRYQQAEVAACPSAEGDNFSSYRLAVLLYP
jgi:hypothetical protein